jgi:branched-chain amino acid aminotransferase
MFAYLNGQILPLSEAKIAVNDIGISRGYGIYDGMTSYQGKPFRFEDHIRRFRASAAALDLRVLETDSQIYAALLKLIELSGFNRTNFRMILTGGPVLSGIEFDPAKPTFVILAEEHKQLPQSLYERGGTLISEAFMRYLPEHKTTNYIHAVRLQDKRKETEAIEILYVHDGKALECATSNIFAVKDGVLVTPQRDILKGITRNVVLELAREQGIKTLERDLPIEELLASDECFITASFKEVVPIVSIDGTPIGNGEVGKTTRLLMDLFAAYTKHA